VRYDAWRPITALALADQDGNDATAAEPDWMPLITTPAHPEYPAGHSGASGAAGTITLELLGDDFDFTLSDPAQPGWSVSYDSITAAMYDFAEARLWGGVHFSAANAAAVEIGRQVATEVVRTQLLSPDAMQAQ
jgi:hypothetical protein